MIADHLTLTDFLLARIAEDEASTPTVRATGRSGGRWRRRPMELPDGLKMAVAKTALRKHMETCEDCTEEDHGCVVAEVLAELADLTTGPREKRGS